MEFRDKRTGYLLATENPVLIDMYTENTEIYEKVVKEEPVKKPAKPRTTKNN